MAQTTSPDTGAASDAAGIRAHLARLLDPVDAVLLTRERLQEVLDAAVRRGRMTRADATDLVHELAAGGRANTQAALSDLDRLLDSSGDLGPQRADRARRATGPSSAVPISGYEDLTATQVAQRLAELGPADLRRVRAYERRNANRKTVLHAVESRLG